MRAVSLMYHDILDRDTIIGSGFSGTCRNRYTLERAEFQAHLATLYQHLVGRPALAPDLLYAQPEHPSVMLTFDDGGVSAYTIVMDVLERYGWKAHFFIATDFIGTPHFLKPVHIRALRARGHVIGSHSCSHPSMMSRLDRSSVLREWADSVNCLSDILGEEVETASLPGGYYSRLIAEAASCTGIRVLFTSEPTRHFHMLGTCKVFGRYAIQARTPNDREAQLLQGSYLLRSKEHLNWAVKKLAKNLGGVAYLKLRALVLQGESDHTEY